MIRFLHGQPLALGAAAAPAAALVLTALGLSSAVGVLAVGALGIVTAVTARDMVRNPTAGHWGLDVLAVVAVIAPVLVGEYITGPIIALTLTGGGALEALAAQRASRELDTLLNRAPAFAHRIGPATSEVEHLPFDELPTRLADGS
ncbi:hypothetical protein [Nocardiopsis quinghaiensis]|uniref:hypothetical protein n=1 Tax=Nocardiopsis quinghaiensis TaxID=464995 RepID=UPI001680C1DE|nr:hypothetical protein [Nocardiopsis quinghaiensis]